MTTPIVDFARRYAESGAVRLHMPGHKGNGAFCERLDITEFEGADDLFHADGIIVESEKNASDIFGAHTFYSTEGSSLSIRAAIYLVSLYAAQKGKKPLIAAGRNAHKAFISALALTGADVLWLCPDDSSSYLSCPISAEYLERTLDGADELPTAVYITSPDYLGSITDIRAISEVCRKRGVLLIVDNAHGAYLKFLSPSLHPIDLGADICCDSAHKTLPCLTGTAYLHISKSAPKFFASEAKTAMSVFASTSPSYLLLQSLDAVNPRLEGYGKEIAKLCERLGLLKERLTSHGYSFIGDEPLKITVNAKAFGYTGEEIYSILKANGIVCEFADSDFTVMMFTPESSQADISKLEDTLLRIEKKQAVRDIPPRFILPKRAMPVRDAFFSPRESISTKDSEGRILAAATVACPPAVPIAVPGEIIDKSVIERLDYYRIERILAVK